MAVQCSPSLMRRLALGVAGAALALLGGCVVAPLEPYEVGAPVVYPGEVYSAPTYYYGAPQPYYYGRPYWGPAVSLDFYGRVGGGRHWHGNRGGGNRHWNHPGRPGGNHWGSGGGYRGGRDGGFRGGRDGGGRRR